jgi:hypothetical protein
MNGLDKAIESFILKKNPWIVDYRIEEKWMIDAIYISITYDIIEQQPRKEMESVHKVTDQLFRMVGLSKDYVLDGVIFRLIK